MHDKDNAVAVVQKAIKYYEIPVSASTIVESLKSHPEYPSLKTICDALDEWKIDNYPMRMNKDELKETGAPFIAHLNDGGEKLAFVPKLNANSTVKYFDSFGKNKSIDESVFFKKYSGVSLLIDPDENSGEEYYSEKKQVDLLRRSLPYLVTLAIVTFISYTILSHNGGLDITLIPIELLVTKLIGFGLSFLLLLKDLNINNSLTDTLCGPNKKYNCNSVLNTNAARVFGWLHWSDVGLIYFLSGLLAVISISSVGDQNLMAIISFGALFYVMFSVYYQAIVAKTWCPLCLLVQGVLITEAILSYGFLLPLQLSLISILKFGSIFLTVVFIVTLYKVYFRKEQASKQERLAYLKFKRNSKVFKNLLFEGSQKTFDISKEIFVIGEPGAPIEVTAFLNLDCNPCQRTFNQLETLFFREDVKIYLVFSLRDKDKPLINWLTQLFEEKKYREAIDLLDTWYNAKGGARISLIKKLKKNKYGGNFAKILKAHMSLFAAAEISTTPAIFINGYSFLREYEIKDIAYFIKALKTN